MVGGAAPGSHGHLFEAVAMKRDGGCGGCLESYRYRLSVLEDRRYGWTHDESLRKEEPQDAIPILSFAEESDSR